MKDSTTDPRFRKVAGRAYALGDGRAWWAAFTPGSSTSGEHGVSTPSLLSDARPTKLGTEMRELGRSQFDGGWTTLPPEMEMQPGVRLLTLRGKRFALGFGAQGPIYARATEHAELSVPASERRTTRE